MRARGREGRKRRRWRDIRRRPEVELQQELEGRRSSSGREDKVGGAGESVISVGGEEEDETKARVVMKIEGGGTRGAAPSSKCFSIHFTIRPPLVSFGTHNR